MVSCSADQMQGRQTYPLDPYSTTEDVQTTTSTACAQVCARYSTVQHCSVHTYIHTYINIQFFGRSFSMYRLCNNYYCPDDHIYDFCVVRSVVLVTTLYHHVVSRQGGITQPLRARCSPLTFASDCTFDRRVSREVRQDHRSRAVRRDHRPQSQLSQLLIMLPLQEYHHQPRPRRASTRPRPGERQQQH